MVIRIIVPLFFWLLSRFFFITGFTSLTMICVGVFFVLFCIYSTCELPECVNLSLLPNLGNFQPLFLQIFILTLLLSLCLRYSNYTYTRHLKNFSIGPEAPHICLREYVWQFSCPVSNFSHIYLVNAQGAKVAIGTDSAHGCC